jgi:hypothetical protein
MTRSHRPEIVLFGVAHPLADGLRAEAGANIVVVVEGSQATVSCFKAGEQDEQLEVSATIDAVVRAIVQIGGTYPDAVQFVQQASSSRCLDSRLAFDAMPSEVDGRTSIHEEAATQDRDIPSNTPPDNESAADNDNVRQRARTDEPS